MLNVALHNCKNAHSDAYAGTRMKAAPFAGVVVEDSDGGRVILFFDDVESLSKLQAAVDNAINELQDEIDIATEDADMAERRGVK